MRTLATIYLLHYTLAPLPGARGTDHRLLTGAGGGGGGQVYCVLHSAAGGETAPPVTRLLCLTVTTHSDHPLSPHCCLLLHLIIRSQYRRIWWKVAFPYHKIPG